MNQQKFVSLQNFLAFQKILAQFHCQSHSRSELLSSKNSGCIPGISSEAKYRHFMSEKPQRELNSWRISDSKCRWLCLLAILQYVCKYVKLILRHMNPIEFASFFSCNYTNFAFLNFKTFLVKFWEKSREMVNEKRYK